MKSAIMPQFSSLYTIFLFTELSTDFDLKFSDATGVDLIHVVNLTSHDLSALSVTLWLRSLSCQGDFILLMLSTNGAPVVKLSNPHNLHLRMLGWVLNNIEGKDNMETAVVFSGKLCRGIDLGPIS